MSPEGPNFLARRCGSLELDHLKNTMQEATILWKIISEKRVNGKDSAHLGKMTERKGGQKLSLKRVKRGSIEGGEIKGSLSKDTPEWKVSKGISGKQHQKKETMRYKERVSRQKGWNNKGSGT
ncbi:hypothetical protein SO802_029954 [Lithocarpus litseifolius]|uniref:Uncharacterized protein n=1 Tax=Lithocarpus litseifolius TaxID=425828 RepID=A0AAW2C071_9ROSI